MGVHYVTEESLYDGDDLLEFCWSGALDRVKALSPEQRDALISHLEMVFADQEEPVTDTQINDYIWFEEDSWLEGIGAPSKKEIVEEMIEDRRDEFVQKIADMLKRVLKEEQLEALKEEHENGEELPEDIVQLAVDLMEEEAREAIKEREEEEMIREDRDWDEAIGENLDEIFDAVFEAL